MNVEIIFWISLIHFKFVKLFHVNIHCLLQHSCAPIMAVTNQGGISYAE